MQGNDWLAQTIEPTLEPEIPICDPHHHSWEYRPEPAAYQRYLLQDLVDDINRGHNVLSTVFIEARPSYHTVGPEEMRSGGKWNSSMAWRRPAPPDNTVPAEWRQTSSAEPTSSWAKELSQCWKHYRQPVLTGSAGFAIRSVGTPIRRWKTGRSTRSARLTRLSVPPVLPQKQMAFGSRRNLNRTTVH